MSELKLIYTKLADIQAEVEAIAKDRHNSALGYDFRGVEDVLNMLHGLLSKHRVVVVPEKVGERHEDRPNKRGDGINITRVYDIKYTAYAEDGSSVSAIVPGEGMDSGDKASNKALSGSYKYWAFLTFSIPTAGVLIDGDNGSPEPGKSQPKAGKGTEGNGNNTTNLKREIGEIMMAQRDCGGPLFSPEEVETARGNIKACKSIADLQSVKAIWKAEAEAKRRDALKTAKEALPK